MDVLYISTRDTDESDREITPTFISLDLHRAQAHLCADVYFVKINQNGEIFFQRLDTL